MAFLHARSNVCRSGVTHAGLANQPLGLTIGGVSRAADVLVDGFAITTTVDGSPSTCTLVVTGVQPTEGQDLILTLGGALLWGGTIMRVRAVAQKLVSDTVFWHCQAIDWTWLLDRFARVTALYENLAVNTLVATILAGSTNGGFQPGWIDGSLGTIDRIQFTGETVSNALARVAKAANNGAGAYYRLRADKSVDLFSTLSIEGNPLSLSNSSDIRDVIWDRSLTEIRTRVFYAGGGAQTSGPVASGAVAIPVDALGWYAPSGQVLVEQDIISYTGKSTTSAGAGSLTGCTGIDRDIPAGATVAVLMQVDDATAQSNLATLLGSGRSGIATAWFSDGRLAHGEATKRASADLAFYKAAIPALEYTTNAKWAKPGKVVSVSITSPFTISGNFLIQSVTIRPFGAVDLLAASGPIWQYQVITRLARRVDVTDLLLRV